MGRKRQSPAEDFMDLVALMPWWAGVTLGVVSYLVLHRLAVPPVVTLGTPPADVVKGSLISALATAGQYLVPLLCGFGAIASAMRRRHRVALFNKAASSTPKAAIAEMSWREFEMLVGEAYRLHGYSVMEMGGGGADGGVDLVLRRDAERFFVQCKHWKSSTVGVTVVRELFGVMSARGATGGAVVTGGTFTAEAKAFAAECRIQLVDGTALPELLRHAKAMHTKGPVERMEGARAPARAAASPPVQAEAIPACPSCGSTMVRRTARKGASAGAQFWGCSRFPACRGTR